MVNINDLKNSIKAAIAIVDIDVLQCTQMEPEYHLDIVHMTNGANVECV
jgi:hypothetical protein